MKEIIEWLAGLECRLGEYYSTAKAIFADDPEIMAFAAQLSADEFSHCETMKSALELIKDEKVAQTVVLDAQTRRDVEARLRHYCARILVKGFTKKDFVESVVELERHEVNKIYTFALRSMSSFTDHYESTLECNERHLGFIDEFVRSRPEYEYLAERLSAIPELRRERILFVEGPDGIIDLCRVFLESEAALESAANGAEALDLVGANWYSAIVTDIDMPVMDGIEFYTKAVEGWPELKDRFVFLTGAIDSERKAFFDANNVRHIEKPVSMKEITRHVIELLDKP